MFYKKWLSSVKGAAWNICYSIPCFLRISDAFQVYVVHVLCSCELLFYKFIRSLFPCIPAKMNAEILVCGSFGRIASTYM